ncbi:MAG: B12-binding domain-containing protein [Sedimentisphaerales bacterium]|nr:B12-binding domain-containing protein [Sedimentisphaerales bacterium]
MSANLEKFLPSYLEKLIQGDRIGCRKVLGEALQTGTPANIIFTDLFWPVMVEVERLYRSHHIDIITEHMATRINRTLVDQLQSKLPQSESRNKKIIITCAGDEPEELGAQMCADLFESDGWEVKFIGGGVPNDEIMALVGIFQPDILFIFGTKPSGAPDVRRLIDTIREVGSCPAMRFLVSGGLFNRADGLWEEIGADMFALTAKEALKIALTSQKADLSKRNTRRSGQKVYTSKEA